MKLPLLFLSASVFALTLGLQTPLVAQSEGGRVVISDSFKHQSPNREPDKPLDGVKLEVGEGLWSASKGIVFGIEGVTTGTQSNEWASFPFQPSAFGLDKKPFALRVQIRFARASHSLWFGFGKSRRPSCSVVLNAKTQTWKIVAGEKEDMRTGECVLNGDVNLLEFRVDPVASTCDFLVNGETVAEKVPMFIDPSTFTMVNLRFFFLSRFQMNGVEVVEL